MNGLNFELRRNNLRESRHASSDVTHTGGDAWVQAKLSVAFAAMDKAGVRCIAYLLARL